MNRVHIYGAIPCAGREWHPCEIIVSKQLPEYRDQSLDECLRMFKQQGEQLENALRNALPGGTYDALLVAMLDHTRSRFRVTHTKE